MSENVDRDSVASHCSLRDLVIYRFGGFGAMSPTAYRYELGNLAHVCGRELNDEFRKEVAAILKELPCPMD